MSGVVWSDPATAAAILNTFDSFCQSTGALNQTQFENMFVSAGATFERVSGATKNEESNPILDAKNTGVMNETWGSRLFVAMDGDNTGSLDPYELVEGLRAASGVSIRREASEFAFAMLGTDVNSQVTAASLRTLVSEFECQARAVVEAWVTHFEQVFGELSSWRSDAALRQVLLQLNVTTQEAIDRTCEALEVRSQAGGSADVPSDVIGYRMFSAWCEDSNEPLGILGILREMVIEWVEWMASAQRDRDRRPSQIPRMGFAELSQTASPQRNLSVAVAQEGASVSNFDRGLEEVFSYFATHGQMSLDDFHSCFLQLGLPSAYLRSRLFAVCAEDSRFVCLDMFSRFVDMLVCSDPAIQLSLAFKIFDTDDNGFVTEDEVTSFVSSFFVEARGTISVLLLRLRKLFGSKTGVDACIQQTCMERLNSFQSSVVAAMFSTHGIAPAPGGLRRLYFSEFSDVLGRSGQFSRMMQGLATHLRSWLEQIGCGKIACRQPPPTVGPSSTRVQLLHHSMTEVVEGQLEFKAKTQRQPKAGAPRIPKPSSYFSRQEVRHIQQLFSRVSQNGTMGPREWIKCLSAAGVHNEYIAERLFEMFDSSGDKLLTAKEFTCGLSDICNDRDDKGELSPTEVRKAFAFRFYDSSCEGYFHLNACSSFLKSFVACSRAALRVANESFLNAYGIDQGDLPCMQSSVGRPLRNAAVLALYDEVTHQLDSFCRQMWDKYADGQVDMNWKQFEQWAADSKQIFAWLTDQGRALADQFENLSEMSFDESVASPAHLGTHLSVARIKSCFNKYSLHGLMDRSTFSRCITDLVTTTQKWKFSGLGVQGLLDALFLAVDTNRNGALTQDEFTDAMATIVTGTPHQKNQIALKVHDCSGAGYIDHMTMRNYFSTYFSAALKKIDVLCQSLELWVRSSSGGSGACYEVASNLRKSAAREVSVMADALVEYAMQSSSRGSEKLYYDDFPSFISRTAFTQLMASIGTVWMVSDETLATELLPAENRSQQTAALLSHALSERRRLAKSAPSGEGYFGLLSKPSGVTGGRVLASVRRQNHATGDVWLLRRFASCRHGARRQCSPRTILNELTFQQVSILQRRVLIKGRIQFESLIQLLQKEVQIPLWLERSLRRLFDVKEKGTLVGVEVLASLLLLARGPAQRRIRLAFDLFDTCHDGFIVQSEVASLLRAFGNVAKVRPIIHPYLASGEQGVVEGAVETLEEICGRAQASTGGMSSELRQKLIASADSRLQNLKAAIEANAAFSGGDRQPRLKWEDFLSWVECSRPLSLWLECLGPLFLQRVPRIGVLVKDDPLAELKGLPFQHLTVQEVVRAATHFSTRGKMGPMQLRACLVDFKLASPLLARRMFTLFDRELCGSIAATDFTVFSVLMCVDTLDNKFAQVFQLYDHDAKGFLLRSEVLLFFELTYSIAMDAGVATLCSIDEILTETDLKYSYTAGSLVHSRIRCHIDTLVAELELFLENRCHKCYCAAFICWAQQSRDFLRWLSVVRFEWLNTVYNSA